MFIHLVPKNHYGCVSYLCLCFFQLALDIEYILITGRFLNNVYDNLYL